MLRNALLWLSGRDAVFNFVRGNGLAGRFARRFVAGETLDDAVQATRALNARDIAVSLDLLGESVSRPDEARAACEAAIGIVDRIQATGLDGNISVKLTQMGLDIDPELAADNMCRLLDRAGAHGIFVRIDMEASPHVEPTLGLFHSRLHPEYGDLVGVVIQAMLRRAAADVEELIRVGARVRLVKGAYKEPDEVAFPRKRDVDANFARLTERLLREGTAPAIATHDERLIDRARTVADRCGLGADGFEFQLLYGVRRDLQEALRRDGYRVRVYVPFGTQWYPYLMRRLAERPANIAFIVGNLVKEAFAGRS